MTNKFYLTVFLLLSAVIPAAAQQFHGGVTAGIAASQVAGDTYSGYNKAGLYGGGWVALDAGSKITFQMELTYFQKGSRKNPDSLDYSSYLFRADYVELPVLVMYKINKFTVFAGPSAGFLVGYKEEVDEYPSYSENTPAAVTIQINAGIRFDLNDRWGVDFRTNNSLFNIRKYNVSGDVWRLWGYGQFHDVLVLSAFYRIK